jgi:SAM-dependent methyltransferase
MTADSFSSEYWQTRGAYWDQEADLMARAAQALNQPLIDAADIGEGMEVLDLASGPGEPAFTIAELVGPGGRVVATDLVEEMLAGTRRRITEQGLRNMTAEIADMQALPFGDECFDRVTCRFGIMFVPDPALAFSEIRRVLRPGGRCALMVWGPRAENTMLEILHRAMADVLGPANSHDGDAPFRFAPPGSMTTLFEAAGFATSEEIEVKLAPKVDAGKRFWEVQFRMNVGPALEGHEDAENLEAAIREKVEAGFAATVRDGRHHLSIHARIGTGTAPQVGG